MLSISMAEFDSKLKRKAEIEVGKTNERRKSTRIRKTPNYEGNLLKGIVI